MNAGEPGSGPLQAPALPNQANGKAHTSLRDQAARTTAHNVAITVVRKQNSRREKDQPSVNQKEDPSYTSS